MKILLTGHRGFIGGHMLLRLQAEGHEVTTYEWGDPYPQISGHNWCIHLGAISSTTERDIEKVLRQNLDFSIQLYEDCKSVRVKFQYASSASVYGLVSTFKEDAPVDPRTPYAWSKYLFERYVQNNPSSFTAQGFRYFNVYGPNGEEHKGNQASPFMQFQQQAKTLGRIEVFENSEKYCRDFIHVGRVVDTHMKFLNVKESGVWNVGTGQPRSFYSVAQLFDVPIDVVPMPAELKNSYQAYTCADTTKLENTLKASYSSS
jgi:ADP-L-glycero-D-manno-heptose 6-epimerase